MMIPVEYWCVLELRTLYIGGYFLKKQSVIGLQAGVLG
jgi:hypothetical protein